MTFSRTTVLVFVAATGAVFGLLVLVKPPPVDFRTAGRHTQAVLQIQAARRGPTWKSIVIHQSHTLGGRGETVDQYWREAWQQPLGMGWHFLIERRPRDDGGLVYASPRWRQQADGYHVFGRHDADSIGVCVVGLMTRRGPTEAQFQALVWLVRRLQQTYKIPSEGVLLHRQIDPDSHCPGPAFPAEAFRQQLLKVVP